MSAVFDTSPLCFLVLLEQVEIAPILFEKIFIPPAVAAELSHPRAPRPVSRWLSSWPDWLSVRDAAPGDGKKPRYLHDGEYEAILLAQQSSAEWLVIDEIIGRRAASKLGLQVTGLLGVLGRAAERDLLDLPTAVQRLRETHFRVSEELLQKLLARHAR